MVSNKIIVNIEGCPHLDVDYNLNSEFISNSNVIVYKMLRTLKNSFVSSIDNTLRMGF